MKKMRFLHQRPGAADGALDQAISDTIPRIAFLSCGHQACVRFTCTLPGAAWTWGRWRNRLVRQPAVDARLSGERTPC